MSVVRTHFFCSILEWFCPHISASKGRPLEAVWTWAAAIAHKGDGDFHWTCLIVKGYLPNMARICSPFLLQYIYRYLSLSLSSWQLPRPAFMGRVTTEWVIHGELKKVCETLWSSFQTMIWSTPQIPHEIHLFGWATPPKKKQEKPTNPNADQLKETHVKANRINCRCGVWSVECKVWSVECEV